MSDVEGLSTQLAALADTAAEAVRGINHATIAGPALPAPCVYDPLGSLARMGYGLEQAICQIADRLAASIGEFEVYDHDGGDPVEQVAAATIALVEASSRARALGALLDAAQGAIAGQGYHP